MVPPGITRNLLVNQIVNQRTAQIMSLSLKCLARVNSVVVLSGELLREAEKLVNQRIHPMTIIDGFRKAAAIGRAALEASAIDNSV